MLIFMHFLLACFTHRPRCLVLILCNHKSQILLTVSHKINKVHIYTYFSNMYFITRSKEAKNHSSACPKYWIANIFFLYLSFHKNPPPLVFIQEILQRKFHCNRFVCLYVCFVLSSFFHWNSFDTHSTQFMNMDFVIFQCEMVPVCWRRPVHCHTHTTTKKSPPVQSYNF